MTISASLLLADGGASELATEAQKELVLQTREGLVRVEQEVLFRAIENFKMFDMVVELTSGGPGSTTELASINLKREAFEKWRTGYSSAFAIILFVTVFGAANIYVKALNKMKQR